MKNMTTKEFCRKFRACKDGTRFALKYKTMRECYDALLNGEAGGWAVWTYVRAAKEKERVRFALWCANRVRHLMTDKRSTDALNAVQRWLDGEKVDLKESAADACQAAYSANPDQASAAAYHTAYTAYQAAYADFSAESAYYAAFFAAYYAYAADADHAVAEAAQIAHLRELGNPFEEDGEDD